VYSSVKHRSQFLAVIGALLLVADYVVTASLSALDAFHYFNFAHPEWWAIFSILMIGVLNWVGPTKSGNIAAPIAILASLSAAILFLATLPNLPHVQLKMPEGNWTGNWSVFVGIVLALSGVEAVANMTGIMVRPVAKTATRAILPVLFEVCILTFLLGIAMNAIPGLTGHTEDMLRALGDHYIGPWYGSLISLFFGFLLLSAANTAITDLVSIQFLMAKDHELPAPFARLNRFGMPGLALIVAVLVPSLVLIFNHDLVTLAALYAIGVVGAITLNLGSCATNFGISLKVWERTLLMISAIVLFFIELTIAFQKHHALVFATTILVTGLILRYVAKIAFPVRMPTVVPTANVLTITEAKELAALYKSSSLVALKTLNFYVLEEAALRTKALGESSVYLNYVEEIPPGAELPPEISPSPESLELFAMAEQELEKRGITMLPIWQLGEDPGKLIANAAKDLGVNTVMIGTTKRSALVSLLRGDILRTLAMNLPRECHLVISG